MPWNWQLPAWPHFFFDVPALDGLEQAFLQAAGGGYALMKHFVPAAQQEFVVDILCSEGADSSAIEGEILERASLRSSIKRHFGLKVEAHIPRSKEAGMGALMWDVYSTFAEPLTHEMLFRWYHLLTQHQGGYRTHEEPMQIVSNRYDQSHVFFEAPPSALLEREMEQFIRYFNTRGNAATLLGKAALIHLYFESIHPFEDGNGRLGRALIEKFLSQSLGHPTLFGLSHIILKKKNAYYEALGSCNRSLDSSHWVTYFANIILEAQQSSLHLIHFLLAKSSLMHRLENKINARQEKVLLRLFAEGPEGFKGGLSAENYISITKASRPTATRDLKALVVLGALKKEGRLRHTRYYLNLNNIDISPIG